MLVRRWIRITAFLLSTLLCVACGVVAYFTYQSGFLKDTESDMAFLVNILVVWIPFGASLALSFLCENKVWPISLGTIIFSVATNYMLADSGFLDLLIPPVWREMIALFLAIGISYICCLIALFSAEKMDYTTEPPEAYKPPPTAPSPYKTNGAGAYGLPEEMGPGAHTSGKDW